MFEGEENTPCEGGACDAPAEQETPETDAPVEGADVESPAEDAGEEGGEDAPTEDEEPSE